jgi:hypothetical protein
VTLERNSQTVQFVKPNPVYGPGLAVSQNNGFPDKLGLRLIEFGKNGGRSCVGCSHGVGLARLGSEASPGSHMNAHNS